LFVSGEGALSRDDASWIGTGPAIFLRNDACGRSVLFIDLSRRLNDDLDTRRRCLWYMLQIASENEVGIKQGFVGIMMIRQNEIMRMDSSFRDVVGPLMICLPIRCQAMHIVKAPQGGLDHQSYISTMVPMVLQILGTVFDERITHVHIAESKKDISDELEKHDIQRATLPNFLGGDYHYNQFEHWQELRYEDLRDLLASLLAFLTLCHDNFYDRQNSIRVGASYESAIRS
jgi:hypothetical protein